MTLTRKRLLEALHYNPETGAFTWIERRSGRKFGSEAGCKSCGYVTITLDGEHHAGHRLAWFYMTGEWPKEQVDHRDGNGLNNRWDNLREATRQQNGQNRAVALNNTSGLAGVSWHKASGKWAAHIHHNGVKRHLGTFGSKEAAYAEHLRAKKVLHTFQPTPRYEEAA